MNDENYGCTLKGVAMMALDYWQFWDNEGVNNEEYAEMIRTGKIAAYAHIIKHITGRNVGTEMELVKDIISSIYS